MKRQMPRLKIYNITQVIIKSINKKGRKEDHSTKTIQPQQVIQVLGLVMIPATIIEMKKNWGPRNYSEFKIFQNFISTIVLSH